MHMHINIYTLSHTHIHVCVYVYLRVWHRVIDLLIKAILLGLSWWSSAPCVLQCSLCAPNAAGPGLILVRELNPTYYS